MEAVACPSRCRVCNNDAAIDEGMISLFRTDVAEDGDGPELAEVIADVIGVKIVRTDEQQLICRKDCYRRLMETVEFTNQVRKAFQDGPSSCWEEEINFASIEEVVDYEQDEKEDDGEFIVDALEEESQPLSDNSDGELTGIEITPDIGEPSEEVCEFTMPQTQFIATHMQFDNFDYIELLGERCCGCDFIATDLDTLRVHVAESHRHEKSACSPCCNVCGKTFLTLESYQYHKEFYQTKELFVCKSCSGASLSKDALMKHMKECEARRSIPLIAIETDGDDDMEDTLTDDGTQHWDMEPGEEEDDGTKGTKKKRKPELWRYKEALPEESLITNREDYDDYQIIRVDGERCCGCGYFFATYEELLGHANTLHHQKVPNEGKPNVCEICKEQFRTVRALKNHKSLLRNLKEIYHCKLCDLTYIRRFHLARHFRTSAKHLTAQRKDTPISLDAEMSWLLSKMKPDPNRIQHGFACCFLRCTQVFTEEKDLHEHVAEMHDVRRNIHQAERTSTEHVCDVCQRNFSNVHTLYTHRYSWMLKKTNICSYCGTGFAHRSQLREHELQHNADGTPQYDCSVCGKQFKRKSLLKLHMVTHEETRRFSCEQCVARFRFGHQLKKHQQCVHPTDFPYECKYCDKRMSSKVNYDRHIRQHTGEKPYVCRFGCDRSFSHSTDRRRHEMAKHTDERPHQCIYCNTAFIRKRELVLHHEKHPEHRV